MSMDPLTALGAKIGGPAADESTRVQRGIDYVFALELVKAMKSGAIDSESAALGSGAYGDMVTEALAGSLAASGGLGFGRYMVKQLEARKASIAAAEAEAEAEAEAALESNVDKGTPASGTPAVDLNLFAR
jgi:Rod binding domain-containing protein